MDYEKSMHLFFRNGCGCDFQTIGEYDEFKNTQTHSRLADQKEGVENVC